MFEAWNAALATLDPVKASSQPSPFSQLLYGLLKGHDHDLEPSAEVAFATELHTVMLTLPIVL